MSHIKNPNRVPDVSDYYAENEMRDMVYNDIWSFFQNYLALHTGILPMPVVKEAEAKTLQGAVDVITEIILDSTSFDDNQKEEK